MNLFKNGISTKYLVHRLICCTFLNKDLLSTILVVNHINGIRNDNRLCNLEIISQLENNIDELLEKI